MGYIRYIHFERGGGRGGCAKLTKYSSHSKDNTVYLARNWKMTQYWDMKDNLPDYLFFV